MTGRSTEYGRGRIALLVGHCAGLVDMIRLPLWVGVLVDVYRFGPQQAGGIATVFLAGVFLASVLVAPQFHRVSGRALAVLGFGTAAACFWIAATTQNTALLLAVHGLAGLANGLALSVTHGTISTSRQAHRLKGIAGVTLGVFGMLFMIVVPKIIGAFGGPALFVVFGGVMAIAALTALAAFPGKTAASDEMPSAAHARQVPPRAVWIGLVCWALVSFAFSMTSSFMERAGIDNGFSRDQVATSLLIMATVSMFAGALAVHLEGRRSLRSVSPYCPLSLLHRFGW